MGAKGWKALGDALRLNSSLTELDMSLQRQPSISGLKYLVSCVDEARKTHVSGLLSLSLGLEKLLIDKHLSVQRYRRTPAIRIGALNTKLRRAQTSGSQPLMILDNGPMRQETVVAEVLARLATWEAGMKGL